MDNRSDRFAGGFLAGTIFGSVVGGVLGVLLATKLNENLGAEKPATEVKPKEPKPKKRQSLKSMPELTMEEARQGLEAKIAQLNDAIDDVRHQLSNVNGRE
jgi:gas vesicle protein